MPAEPATRLRPPARSRLAAAVLLTAGVALAPAALPGSPAHAAITAATTFTGGPVAPGYGDPGLDGPGPGGAWSTTSGLERLAAQATRGQPAPLSARGAVTPAEQREVERYWTADRRARAFGTRTTGRADSADSAAGIAGTAGGGTGFGTGAGGRARTPVPFGDEPVPTASTLPPPASTGTSYASGGLVTTTTGRLFTTIDGADYACSASVVTSPGKDLVVTAGHCLHGGARSSFARHVVFIPGYDNGTMPYGLWTARQLTVTPGWASSTNFDVDTGFALFNTNNGQHLEDAVGAQNIAFDLPSTVPQYTFGYPRLLPYDGRRLIYCAGPGFADPYGGPSTGVACRMTAGASGGPLLTGLGRLGPGHGWIDGVVSYAYAGNTQSLYGTHFGPVVRTLYYQSLQL